jgi:hypothetical protein
MHNPYQIKGFVVSVLGIPAISAQPNANPLGIADFALLLLEGSLED